MNINYQIHATLTINYREITLIQSKAAKVEAMSVARKANEKKNPKQILVLSSLFTAFAF